MKKKSLDENVFKDDTDYNSQRYKYINTRTITFSAMELQRQIFSGSGLLCQSLLQLLLLLQQLIDLLVVAEGLSH